MKRLCILLATLGSMLLAGCSSLSGLGEDRYWMHGDRWHTNDVTALLAYHDYLRGLPADAQLREQDRARQAFAKDKSDFHRLQLALALDAPAASSADRRQSMGLLEPLARDAKGHDKDLHLLAQFMVSSNRRSDDLERKLDAVKDIERNLLPKERRPAKGERDTKGQTP